MTIQTLFLLLQPLCFIWKVVCQIHKIKHVKQKLWDKRTVLTSKVLWINFVIDPRKALICMFKWMTHPISFLFSIHTYLQSIHLFCVNLMLLFMFCFQIWFRICYLFSDLYLIQPFVVLLLSLHRVNNVLDSSCFSLPFVLEI